jgi:hypothetical protein
MPSTPTPTPKRLSSAISPASPIAPSSVKQTPTTPTSASSKRDKWAHPKATESDLVVFKPGIETDTRSFRELKFWERPSELTAYCNFTNIFELRRFAVSPYTLRFYNNLATTGKSKRTTVLELLRDCEQELLSDKDPISLYPDEADSSHADQRWALSISQMYRTIQKALSKEAVLTQAELDAAHLRFETIKSRNLLTLNIEDVEIPDLGPFEANGECKLEAYNRCYNLLRYVGFSSNDSTWPMCHGSARWEDSHLITSSYMPHWMKPANQEVSMTPQAPDTCLLQTGRPALDVEVIWNVKTKLKEPAEWFKFTKEEGLDDRLPDPI